MARKRVTKAASKKKTTVETAKKDVLTAPVAEEVKEEPKAEEPVAEAVKEEQKAEEPVVEEG